MRRYPAWFRIFCLTLILGCNHAAFAASTDCNLSLLPGAPGACPAGAIGANTPHANFLGARLEPKTSARTAIDAFGMCRYVSNDSDAPLFIPFGSEEEWRAFQTNHPDHVVLTQCTRGGAVPIPPNFAGDGASNQCVNLPPLQAAYVPYKPAAQPGTYTTPTVTYSCKSADGTAFDESATATLTGHDSGYGPDNALGWSFAKILYSYNGVCGPAKGVEVKTAPTANLCSVGVPSAVIGTGPFTWICGSGNGGGKNITCSTGTVCETHKVEEKPCQCDGDGCFRAVLWADDCGHSWIDKSQHCDKAEPQFKPLPPIDYDNDRLSK